MGPVKVMKLFSLFPVERLSKELRALEFEISSYLIRLVPRASRRFSDSKLKLLSVSSQVLDFQSHIIIIFKSLTTPTIKFSTAAVCAGLWGINERSELLLYENSDLGL